MIYVIYAQVLRCGRTEGHQSDTVTRQGLHRLTCGGAHRRVIVQRRGVAERTAWGTAMSHGKAS